MGKRTFRNCSFYRSGDVLFIDMEVFKGQGNDGDAWRDEYGAIFIIFTIKEMMRLLHLGNKKINKMLKKLEVHNLIYRSHQGLGKPNKIYVYDLLKADNSNWLPKQFKHRKGRTNEKEIL